MTGLVPLTGAVPRATPVLDPGALGLRSRIAAAIEATRGHAVVYEDMLGEGEGAWHGGARYPTGRVNCLTWLLLVLAEAYGNGDRAACQRVMDDLRYYGGHVGFSMRKHYLEQWLAFDPGPLRQRSLREFHRALIHESRIEPGVFLARRAFDTSLYHADQTQFDIEYAEPWTLCRAAERLPSGFYVIFAVPTASFTEQLADRCGPLGLVHCAVLQLDPGPGAVPDGARPLAACTVHHASIVAGAVRSVPLDDYLLESVTIHRGYTVCELDPAWRPSLRPWTEEARRLVERERQFEQAGFRPWAGF